MVSVVIPVYNGEKTIGQTLECILASNYHDLELIVVIDGTKDRSKEICQKLQQKDARIHIYEKENGGIASARNYGVERATGHYLCFCDQDDFVEEETYQRMVKKIEQDQSDICICSTGRSVDGKRSLFEKSEDACYRGAEVAENLLYPMLFKGYDVPIKMGSISRYASIWCCMFRMEFWKKYQFKFRIYVNYEDDLLMKADTLSRASVVSTIAYPGYYWNINLKSESHTIRFVENLAEKQELYFKDMEASIKRCTTDEQILKLYRQVTRCKHYLDAIHIFLGAQEKNAKYIREFYQKTIYENDFAESISGRMYVKKGQVRAKVLLPLLARKMSVASFVAEKLLDRILWISLHSQVLTKLERRIKEKQ